MPKGYSLLLSCCTAQQMLVFILPSSHREPGLWQPFQSYLGKQFYRTSLETTSQTKSHCEDFSTQIFFSFLLHHSTHFCTCQNNVLTLVFITYIYGLEVIALNLIQQSTISKKGVRGDF